MNNPLIHGSSQTLDTLKQINHKVITVGELINILARQSPMMPVLCYDEDEGSPKYFNGIRIDDSGDRPVFIIYSSSSAKGNDISLPLSYDEEIAEQRSKAMDLVEDKRKHMEMLE